MSIETIQGFLLTRNWRDTDRGIELEFWFSTDSGPICALVPEQRSLFFLREGQVEPAKALLRAERGIEFKDVALKSFDMCAVQGVYFKRQRTLRRAADLLRAQGLEPLESDLSPADRFLMERFITGGAALRGEVLNRADHRLLRNDH